MSWLSVFTPSYTHHACTQSAVRSDLSRTHASVHSGGIAHGRQGAAQGGSATVEFALLLPWLLALLLGVVEMGLALHDKAVLTQACREGARAGIVMRSPKLSVAEVQAIVQQQAQAQLVSLLPAAPVQVSVQQSSPAAYPNTLQVAARYTFQGLAWGSLLQALGVPLVIQATVVMVHE